MIDRVNDFKDYSGHWVYRFYNMEGIRLFTRAGVKWHGMKQRCNPQGNKQKVSPLYTGCTHTFEDFQDFAEWCQSQVGYRSDFELDKDLLVRGNKIYNKDTIVFIPQELNKLLTKRTRYRGDLPIGCVKEQGSTTFRAAFTRAGKKVNLGNYKTPDEAFFAYKLAKEDFIKQQATKWKDQIDLRAYEALINYEVLITD